MPPRQRVCVVGSGISGLSISWLLSDAYDVTILEKHERLGMDAHGLMVTGTDGSSIRLDAPPRAISADFYYNLMQLYKQADVDAAYGMASTVTNALVPTNPETDDDQRVS